MVPHDSPLTAVLDEIERILEEEREALRHLNRPVIDRCAEQKTALEATLRAVLTRQNPGELQRARIERLKASALVNQMLISQARNCIRGILALATGQGASSSIPPAPASIVAQAAPTRRLLVQG